MKAGIEIYNTSGDLLISSNEPNIYVHTYLPNLTMPTGVDPVVIPYAGWPETPTLLLRPRAGLWYGWTHIRRSGNNLLLYISNLGTRGTFDLALASTAKSVTNNGDEGFGLQIFDANGELNFSSSRKYPRVKQIAAVPGPNLTVANSTTSAAITTTFDDMPWVIFRDATQAVPFSVNESASSVGFYFSVNTAKTAISVRGSDTIASNSGNQYWGRNLYFPLCQIPGI